MPTCFDNPAPLSLTMLGSDISIEVILPVSVGGGVGGVIRVPRRRRIPRSAWVRASTERSRSGRVQAVTARASKLAMRVGFPLPLVQSASQRDRLWAQLACLVWLLCTVELSIFHRPSSAPTRP
jgi:hypothetical protein